MAEKSGFFNAILADGDYDRKYNANDYSDNLAVVISNGVLRSTGDDLAVTASGMICTVAAGRAWINGHYYYNDTPLTLAPITAPTGGSRYDRVMLRLDNNLQQRKVYLLYVQGTASNDPQLPAPTRTDLVYDLVLADIYVTANAANISVTDERANTDLCGWVYSTSGDNSFFTSLDNDFYAWFTQTKDTLSSVTLFKRYKWRTVLTAEETTVQFDIPQYDVNTCFVEVYVNGMLDYETDDYTLANNVITFNAALTANTEVIVYVYKSIDGTGIESVSDEITELQNSVAALEGGFKYIYNCKGLNDNTNISQIVTALANGVYNAADVTETTATFLESLGGNTYLGELDADAQMTIEIAGKFAATNAFLGQGTDASPWRWIACDNAQANMGRKIILDFAKCESIQISCPDNTTNSIFYGANINVKNANVNAYGYSTATNIMAFECAGNGFNAVNVDNCKIKVQTSGTAKIAEHGNYTNCYCYCMSENGAAYCFKPTSATFIRLNGGTYLAYGLTTSGIGSAIAHTSASETDAVLMAYNIHCPVIAENTYTQGYLSVANAGTTYINGVVSRLTSSGAYNQITGQINKNKA